MKWNFYNAFKNSMILNSGAFQFASDDIKILLVTDQYTFSATQLTTTGSLTSGDEIEGEGYDAGGQSLTGKNRVNRTLVANDVTWEDLTASVAGAILYKASGNGMIAFLDFEEVHSPNATEFKIAWNEGVVFELTTD